MNPTKHKFELSYNPETREWDLYDDGVLHSGNYDSRKTAQKVVDQLSGKSEKMSKRSLVYFMKKWNGKMKDDMM